MNISTSSPWCENSIFHTIRALRVASRRFLGATFRTSYFLPTFQIRHTCALLPYLALLRAWAHTGRPRRTTQTVFTMDDIHMISQRALTSFPIHLYCLAFVDFASHLLAHVFYNLKLSFDSLLHWYQTTLDTIPTMVQGQPRPLMFPAVRSYGSPKVSFEYVRPLQLRAQCTAFFAIRIDAKAKFVINCVETDHGYAPKPLYYSSPYYPDLPHYNSCKMVVAEYSALKSVHGSQTLSQAAYDELLRIWRLTATECPYFWIGNPNHRFSLGGGSRLSDVSSVSRQIEVGQVGTESR